MTRRALPGILPFPEPDARSGVTVAVAALLAYLGRPTDADRVHVLSGCAFRWYHADRDDFDPRSDPMDFDATSRAFAVAGVTGRWFLDLPLPAARAVTAASLGAGRPVLSVNVPGYPARGVQIVAGEDPGRETWLVQGGFATGPREWNEGGEYLECALRPWTATVPGPAGRVPNPVYRVDHIGRPPERPTLLTEALEAARILSRPGRGGPSEDPVPRGPDAHEALIEDLLLGRSFAEGNRLPRLEVALGSLARDRRAVRAVLGGVAREPGPWGVDEEAAEAIAEAARCFGQVGGLAETLRKAVLCRDLGSTDESDAVLERIEGGHELAYGALLLPPAVLAEVRAEGYETVEGPGGTVISADSADRRGMAARLAAEIRDRDADAFAALAAV